MVAKKMMIGVMMFTAIVHSAGRSVPQIDVYQEALTDMPCKSVPLITGDEVEMPTIVDPRELTTILLNKKNTPNQKTLEVVAAFLAAPHSYSHNASPAYVEGMCWLADITQIARLPDARVGKDIVVPSYLEKIVAAAIDVRRSPDNKKRQFVMRDPFAEARVIPARKNGAGCGPIDLFSDDGSSEQRGESKERNMQYNKDDGLIFEIEI